MFGLKEKWDGKNNMCGIAGFWKNTGLKKEIIIYMTNALSHRGPDDEGYYIDEKSGIALGHRRLSVLDLSPKGNQPMKFDNLIIVYNGEVYNFKEIKKELEKYGYSFDSDSDTEVILKAFHRWGFDCVNKFRGMWAFAIWDKKNKKLILCRDRIGVKPLFWYYKNGLFMFSSELKSFHKHPDFNKELNLMALSLYLQYGYITSPYCIFKYTYKLEPGHFLIINKNGEIKKEQYWDVKKYFLQGIKEKHKWFKKSENEIAEELEEILTESFKLRMVSDVPVGIFLSGGIDSSLVTALLQKEYTTPLKTFTIGFYEKEYNEAHWAKKVAEYLGTEHTELYCTPKEAFEIIPKLPDIYDEPFGDSSGIPTRLVSELAKTKVKVSLSADGGDEQFCGYPRYWVIGNKIRKLSKLPIKGLTSKVLNLLNPQLAFILYTKLKFILPKWTNFRDKYIKLRNVLMYSDIKTQYDISNKYFLYEDLKQLGLKNRFSQLSKLEIEDLNNLDLMMYMDLNTYLPDDLLVKVDRATMSISLEGRDPFLDHKILEYSSRLPIQFKYRNGKGKYILRKILYKYVPKKLIKRPKQGFGVPIYEWFKSELRELYCSYLNKERIKREGIFNSGVVDKLLKDYLEDKGINPHKLWFLFIFELWNERWKVC